MDFNIHVRQIINIRAKNDLAHADAITGDQFELYMTHVLNHSGYHHVIHTPYSNDHGVDAYSKVDSISWQFKDYAPTHPVSYHAVVEVLMGGLVYGTKYNVVLTNSYFPKSTWKTIRRANQNHYKNFVTLIDRKRLLKLFKTYERRKIERSAIYQKQKKQAEIKKRIEHKEYRLASILTNKLDTFKRQINSINDNIISILSDNVNGIKNQSSIIENKFTSILRYRLSNLLTRIKYISHLKKLLSLYLANNTLRNNITKSESIHNFNSRTKQFAYYALRILPKYHVTLSSLAKKIDDSIETIHPLSNRSFYNTITINIEYPRALNQRNNYTKQHIIFAYYPLKHINKNGYPKHIFNFTNKLYRNDISTIITNFQCNDIIAKDGYYTRKQIMPIDKNSNLYSQDKFSVNTKVFDVFNTHVNINDINVLTRIMKLNQNSDYKKEVQFNANYLNEFYQDRKIILSKIKVIHKKEKHIKAIHKLRIHKNSKKYHKLNNIIEKYIENSKKIHNFYSRTKQFAFCALTLLPTFHKKFKAIIYDIVEANVKKSHNWHNGYNNKKNYCPFGSQINKSYYYLILDIRHKKSFERIFFIYYSPKMMKTEYKGGFPYQNLYKKVIKRHVHYRDEMNWSLVPLNINKYIFISNFIFESSHYDVFTKSFNYRSNHLGNICYYRIKYNNIPIIINDLASLITSSHIYNKKRVIKRKNRRIKRKKRLKQRKLVKAEKSYEAKLRYFGIQTKRQQRMYENAQRLRHNISNLGQKGIEWIKHFVNQHMQTKPYMNTFKICPNCHSKVSKSAHFCINCGYHFIK